jgi:DNA-binding PadR family transcriptional regulator
MNGPGGDISPLLPLRPIEFLILAALEHGQRHGYGIVQAIESRTGGAIRIRPGDLYRVLYRMAERGWLEVGKRGKPSERDERRTYYRLTDLGRRVLHAEADVLSQVIAGISREAEGSV